jgi:hypothetical protein
MKEWKSSCKNSLTTEHTEGTEKNAERIALSAKVFTPFPLRLTVYGI